MPKRVAREKIEDAIAELNKVRKNWLKRPEVTAVDVGYKIRDDELTDELAIRIHVQRKRPPEALASYETFTTSEDPQSLNDIPLDVIEAEYGPAVLPQPLAPEQLDRRGRVDPLIGGVSVGNPRVTAGTLGAIVWDTTDGEACILSNWHILCGSSGCVAGEAIWQPGRLDSGTAGDVVAELKRNRLDRDADAALARLTGNRSFTRDILEWQPITGIEENPTLGMNVIKSGRTTGLTEGVIDGVSLSLTLNYGGGVVQTFHDQLHIVPRPPWPSVDYEVSRGGDSGSVWITESNGRAVGLHFAGERDPAPSSENAIANRMHRVAERLEFSFTPVFRRPPVIDDRLRDLIRRILCRRFPWLCYRLPQQERLPAGPMVGTVPQHVPDVDEVVNEIMEELRRSQ